MDESNMTTAEEFKIKGWIQCKHCGQRFIRYDDKCPWCKKPIECHCGLTHPEIKRK